MSSRCVFSGLAAVYWLILDSLVVCADIPICLTWNTTDSYLTITCKVPIAKHDIVIVDPFGNNRGQCILTNSPPCIRSYKADLLFEENLEKFKILTLRTDKHYADGVWQCRYGFEETTSYVSYKKGMAPNINIEISGKIKKINLRNSFTLTCSSCWTPYVKGVEIYVNNVLEDSIRYHEDLCYHRRHLCMPDRCTCSDKGKKFTWTFMTDLPNINFTCAMRFKDAITSMGIIRQADLAYNGSAFIRTQTTYRSLFNSDKHSHNFTISVDMDDQNDEGRFGFVVLGLVVIVLLVILMTCIVRIYTRRKKYTTRKKQGIDTKSEDISLLLKDNEEDKNNQDEFSTIIEIGEDNIGEDKPLLHVSGIDTKSEDKSLLLKDNEDDKNNQDEFSTIIEIGEDNMGEDKPLLHVSGIDTKSEDKSLLLKDNDEDKNNQDEFSTIIEIGGDNMGEDKPLLHVLGEHTLSRKCLWIEEFELHSSFSKSQWKDKFTSNLVTDISKYGFQTKNIKLTKKSFFDNICSDIFATVQKLLIVFPRENGLYIAYFDKLVETAVDILPIVLLKKANLLLWFTKMEQFRSSGSTLIDALLRCPKAKTMDGARESLIIYHKTLNNIIISKKTYKHVAKTILEVLKCWELELEKEQMSFRVISLQSISHYQPFCVYDLLTCFIRDTSISFLRFYGLKQLDFGDYKLYSHMHKHFIKLFEIFFGMMLNCCWYNYERNGLSHIRTFGDYSRSIIPYKTPSELCNNMRNYKSRFSSFRNYPIENILFKVKLAFAGFFYFGVDDYVQCVYCKGCLGAWNIKDDPMEKHRQNFKSCPFLLRPDQIIRQRKKTKLQNNCSLDELQDQIHSFLSFLATMSDDELKRLAGAGFYHYRIALDIILRACHTGFADLKNVDDILRLYNENSPECPNNDMCENRTWRMHACNQDCLSNCIRKLKFEVRKHDF